MVFQKLAAKRQIQKLRESNPYLFECETYSNFGRLLGDPTHPAWPHFNQAPMAQGKFYFMPDKTINVIDVDFQNHYQDLTPEKWWVKRIDKESFALHFVCLGLPYEFLFIDLDDVGISDNLLWFKSNYGDKEINKTPKRKGKSK